MHFFSALICKFLMVMVVLQQISVLRLVQADSAEDYAKNLKVPPRFGKRGDALDYNGNESPKYEVNEEIFEPVSSLPQTLQLEPGRPPSPLLVKYFCRLVQRRLFSTRQCIH